jgi:carboxyl-terminal processing protease
VKTAVSRSSILLCLTLTACGGDGGGGGGGNSNPPPPGGWVQGVFAPSSDFDAECVAPRSGTDPATQRPYPDVAGTRTDENNWLRSWTNELYLWYSEVPDQNPALFATADYFDLLKTSASTPSGNPKDRFHFTFPSAEWFQLSQGGISAGYGAQWVILAGTPPRRLVVAYTEPNSPATAPGVNLARGAEVLRVDGIDLVNANDQASINTLNAGLFPSNANQTHTFAVRDLGAAGTRNITMTSVNVTSTPVQNVTTFPTGTGVIGYMLFNDHIATAESQLINAISTLQAASVGDLVLDIRYNGGGFLDIASELAYMIAGAGPTSGQTFERLVFSDKHPTRNPVTGQNLTPVGFHTTGHFLGSNGVALPTLNLSRVFVLTGPGTCSASESIMNSLRGVNVQVIQIGSTTCGKPYGFYAFDNCGTTYFSIQFKGVNAQNFGDYADGFSPSNSLGTPGTLVPGCSIADDFTHALGDPAEGRLAQALNYRATGACSVPPSGFSFKPSGASLSNIDGEMLKSPFLENRILTQ